MTTQVTVENIEGRRVLVQKVESKDDRSVIHGRTVLHPGNRTTFFIQDQLTIRITEMARE